MRQALVLFLVACWPMWATDYTLNTSGCCWGTSSHWTPNGIPGIGDTANIPDGMSVSAQGPITVGTSGAPGTPAITLNNSGQLAIFSSSLTARGDTTYVPNSCANTTPAVTMAAGTSFIFDSSAASSPSTTHYAFGPNGNYGCRPFVSNGTSSARNTVSSNTAGGAGQFSMRGNSGYGGALTATYTDFSNIGDATNPGWQLYYDTYGGGGVINWSVTYSTFTNCGMISPGGQISANGNFIHEHNVHASTAGGIIFNGWNNLIAIGSGTRNISYNVFDSVLAGNGNEGFYPTGFTINGNYFGDVAGFTWAPYGQGPWASFQGNFYHEPSNSTFGYTMQLAGDALDNYWLLDEPVSANPHGLYNWGGGGSAVTSNVFDHTGYMTTQISGLYGNAFPSVANYPMTYNIVLPNAQGHASWWLAVILGLGIDATMTIDHNTIMEDTPTAWNQPGAVLITRHPGVAQTPTGMLASYRSNLMWNPLAVNQAYKSYAYSDTPQDLNPCLPTACDYNAGWNMLTDGGGFSNGGNGYADNFSSVPGQHDVTANPLFVDPTRNMATFDTAYLHNTAIPWSSGAAYGVGNIVSSVDSTVYAGAVINYRYTNGSYGGASCSGTNPKPGLYTNIARACWEWATLYDLRKTVGATATWNGSTPLPACPGNGVWTTQNAGGFAECIYDDQTIGAYGVDIIMTMMQWVRAGYSPTNLVLAGAAHDGTDIGAVPVTRAVSQAITFGALSNQPFGTAPFAVSATASSGLPVSFTSVTPAVCTVPGAMATLLAAGQCSIQASQAGNANFAAATPVTQSFKVIQATPTISWPAPAPITFGGALGNGQLNAGATVPGTFVYLPPGGTVLPVGNGQTLSVTFTPADAADYTTATASTTINVNPAAPTTPGVSLVVTKVLQRTSGNVVVQLTIANTGGTNANNVILTSVKIGSVAGTTLPQTLGTVGAGASVQAVVTVPGSVGVSGAASSLTAAGTFTGGTFSASMRITLP